MSRCKPFAGKRVSRTQVLELREYLTERSWAILRSVAEYRMLTSRQIEALHFPPENHASKIAAARCCRRFLEWLTRDRLLIRLERRVGGARAGSAAFVYTLGPVGERVLDLHGPRRRHREPSLGFLKHTLAISQTAVDLTNAARDASDVEILDLQSEPSCWRDVPAVGGSVPLKPDLFVNLGVGDFEHRWFVEVDLGTEHLPTLIKKCRAYQRYYQSGVEQDEHGVFPRVVWIMTDDERGRRRAERLRDAIIDDSQLTEKLFEVTTTARAGGVMAGGES